MGDILSTFELEGDREGPRWSARFGRYFGKRGRSLDRLEGCLVQNRRAGAAHDANAAYPSVLRYRKCDAHLPTEALPPGFARIAQRTAQFRDDLSWVVGSCGIAGLP